MNTHTQLSQQERYQISALKQAGYNNNDIAAFLGRHKSTIGREVERNKTMGEYQPEQAQHLALKAGELRYAPVLAVLCGRRWNCYCRWTGAHNRYLAGSRWKKAAVSAMSTSTSTSTLTKDLEGSCIVIFAVRRRDGNVTARMIDGGGYLTRYRLRSGQRLSGNEVG